MTAVIRCTACLGLSRIDENDLGMVVNCPRCSRRFLAVDQDSPSYEPSKELPLDAEAVHSEAGHMLPPIAFSSSVLFGLALLPFIIPLAWIAARLITGAEPHVSLAIPIALAIAAATLSLAVVSTIDWQPSTRVKGVLMIVGLAYFAGASLFFLKKDAIEWVKRQVVQEFRWVEFKPPQGECQVRAPFGMQATPQSPLPSRFQKTYQVMQFNEGDPHTFTLAIESPNIRDILKLARWPRTLDQFQKELIEQAAQAAPGVKAEDVREPDYRPKPTQKGREWTMSLDERMKRVVRLYLLNGKLYYLSVEGTNLDSETEEVQMFFNSFILAQDVK